MPAFRLPDGKLGYFAHVPKCAGTAIEEHLRTRFGELAMLDGLHHGRPHRPMWSATSPQHMDAETFERWFPAHWFAGVFATVRHPVPRLVSVYGFQRDWAKKIAADLPFSDWLAAIDVEAEPYAYDGHIRPMHAMVPSGATVFRLEDGQRPIFDWLDDLEGTASPNRTLPRINTRDQYLAKRRLDRPEPDPTPDDIDRIAQLYSTDFEAFGYDPKRPGRVKHEARWPTREDEAGPLRSGT